MGILDDMAAKHGGDILDQLAAKHGGGTPSNEAKDGQYWQYTGGKTPEQARREFKKTGTLASRIRNTPASEIVGNVVKEPARLAQDIITTPVNSAINIGRTLYGRLQNEPYDESRAAAAGMNVRGPLEPSMTGEVIGGAVERGSRSLRDLGVDQSTIDAVTDTLGVFGGAKAAKPVVGGLASLGKATVRPAVRAVAESTLPEKLYGSAVKLPTSQKWRKAIGPEEITKREDAIAAGLANEILPDELGVARSKQLLNEAAETTRGVINEMDSMGNIIPKSRLKEGLSSAESVAATEGIPAQQIVNRMYEKRFNQSGEMRPAINPTVDPFGNPVTLLERFYKPSEMQAIKQHLQKMENYEKAQLSRGLGSQIKELGNKGMAHQAMVALEELNPELKTLNRTTQAYISLVEGIEGAAARVLNNNPVSLGSKVLAAGNIPMAILNQVMGPKIKARIAFALNKARRNPAQIRTGELRQQNIPPTPGPIIPPGGTANISEAQWRPTAGGMVQRGEGAPMPQVPFMIDPSTGRAVPINQGGGSLGRLQLPQGPEMIYAPEIGRYIPKQQ